MRKQLHYLVVSAAAAGWFGLAGHSFADESNNYPKVVNGVRIISRIPDQVVRIGDRAVFIVGAEADQGTNGLVFRWYRNSIALTTNNARITGVETSVLIIDKAERADVGFYTCQIRKNLGDGKLGEPVIAYGKDADAPDPSIAPAKLFVVIGKHTVTSGPYAPGAGTASCIGSFLGKTVFPAPPPPPPTAAPYPPEYWHIRPGAQKKVKIDDMTPGGNGTNYTAKVQIWESTGLNTPCGNDNVQYNNVRAWSSGYAYKFTLYVISSSGTVPEILDLDVSWTP